MYKPDDIEEAKIVEDTVWAGRLVIYAFVALVTVGLLAIIRYSS